MSATYESQVYAECDNCGDYECRSDMKIVTFKNYLRHNGWSIGKRVLCPDCSKKKIKED